MSDGAYIAIDIYAPIDDPELRRRHRVLWTTTPYGRTARTGAGIFTEIDRTPWLFDLLAADYVLCCADIRGTGESEGIWTAPFMSREIADVHEITAALAVAPWSNGSVGMYGKSYAGALQLLASAVEGHGLSCIAPRVPPLDPVGQVAYGPWLRAPFLAAWFRALASGPDASTLPEATVLRAALDSLPRLHNLAEAMPASAVPTLLVSGWLDVWAAEALRWFERAAPPGSSMLMGDWGHGEDNARGLGDRHRRFFDRAMSTEPRPLARPRLEYRVMGAAPRRLRNNFRWPPRGTRERRFGLSGPVNAPRLLEGPLEDLILSTRLPPDATTGALSRWGHVFGTPIDYSALQKQFVDRALPFVSDPLEGGIEIRGAPRLTLRIAMATPSMCLCIVLAERRVGDLLYIAEGIAHIAHPSDPEQGGTGTVIACALSPVAYSLAPGSRLVLAIGGADRDNIADRREGETAQYLDLRGPCVLVLPCRDASAVSPRERPARGR